MHNFKQIDHDGVHWFLYGDGKLRLDQVAINGQMAS